jgi:hypothetical protein
MKKTIGTLLALALMTGAGFVEARGGHGGGHGGGARAGGAVAARPAMSGGFSRFTTGPMRFTTGQPSQFTTGPQRWRPPLVGHPPGVVRPIPLPPRPVQPIHNHPVFVGGGTVIVTAPLYPVYPYAYPYPYAAPVYGGSAYAEVPTYSDAPAYSDSQGDADAQGYSERNDYWYYCPDSQTYYPYVQTCPSPWVKVLPEPSSDAPAN